MRPIQLGKVYMYIYNYSGNCKTNCLKKKLRLIINRLEKNGYINFKSFSLFY